MEYKNGKTVEEWLQDRERFRYYAPLVSKPARYLTREQANEYPVRVVGEYNLPTGTVPVFAIQYRPKPRSRIEVRLYVQRDWYVSVSSTFDIPNLHFSRLFNTGRQEQLFPDFPVDWAFGPYDADQRHFTLRLDTDHDLSIFFFLLRAAMEEK